MTYCADASRYARPGMTRPIRNKSIRSPTGQTCKASSKWRLLRSCHKPFTSSGSRKVVARHILVVRKKATRYIATSLHGKAIYLITWYVVIEVALREREPRLLIGSARRYLFLRVAGCLFTPAVVVRPVREEKFAVLWMKLGRPAAAFLRTSFEEAALNRPC